MIQQQHMKTETVLRKLTDDVTFLLGIPRSRQCYLLSSNPQKWAVSIYFLFITCSQLTAMHQSPLVVLMKLQTFIPAHAILSQWREWQGSVQTEKLSGLTFYLWLPDPSTWAMQFIMNFYLSGGDVNQRPFSHVPLITCVQHSRIYLH